MEKPLCSAEKDLDPKTVLRRNKLYQQYIVPHYSMIYYLVMKYSYYQENVEENYNEALINLYRGIETYKPERSITTWIHIVVKRRVFELEKRRLKERIHCDGQDVGVFAETTPDLNAPSFKTMSEENFHELYSDEVLEVLNMLRPTQRDAIILQEAGYSLKEIAEIEYNKGTLKSRNTETVKSRLHSARQFLRKHLTRNGERKLDKGYDEGI